MKLNLMSKYLKVNLGLLLAAFALLGCNEVKVNNGEIPAEYLSAAQKYVGTYQGTVGRASASLQFAIVGNKAVLTSSTDLAGTGCRSAIGNLKSIKADDKGNNKYVLTEANFAFDRGGCVMFEGRSLSLTFKESGSKIKVKLSMLERTDWRTECRVDGGGNPITGGGPRTVCDNVPYSTYISGKFQK